MNGKRTKALAAAVAASALAALAVGCGSDESGQDTTATAPVALPTVTSPLTTTSTTATGAGKQKGGTKTTAGTGGSAPCSIPDSFQKFRFSGVDCAAAVAVAQAWDSKPNECNTVDNPNVDEGYNRTCSVEGYSCAAKRDVKSDARFVTCTQGGASIRFTWLPG